MEIAIPLVLISFAFEVWLPGTEKYHLVTVSDPFDVAAYFAGAVFSWWVWTVSYRVL